MRKTIAILILLTLGVVSPALAQKKPVKKGIVWDNRPSIVFGKDVKIDVRMKSQLDWRTFDPDVKEPLYDFRSLRFGLKGTLTKHFEWEIERKVSKDWENGDWKDVYFMWKTFDAFTLQGGRFKVPFGLEQNTGSTDLDFAYRSLASSTIAPSRDNGGMASGRFHGRDFTYAVGVFHKDGDNAELKEAQFIPDGEDIPQPGPSIAARITGTPLRKLPVPRRMKSLRLGVAYTNAELPEGLNSFRGKSVIGTKTYFEPVYVKGRRQRIGGELEWTPLNYSLKAEWMQVREDRQQQSNRNQDLSDFLATGWYVSGSWVVTGEGNGAAPKKDLFQGGVGSIEIAARYDELGFGSAAHVGTAFTNPRSDNLVPNTDRVWTIGVNWQPNRWIKISPNAIHENFLDPKRTIESGVNSFWCGLVRLQVVF